jgi:hypothetical protein
MMTKTMAITTAMVTKKTMTMMTAITTIVTTRKIKTMTIMTDDYNN